MTVRKRLFATLAWLQLAISIAMGALIIWTYLTSRAPMDQLMQSIEATMLAGSSRLEGTRETLEARRAYIDETEKLLATLRHTLGVVSDAVENQKAMVPQYAESLQSASNIAGSMGDVLHHTGRDLSKLRIPVGISRDGFDIDVNFESPFQNLSDTFEQNAKEVEGIQNQLLTISDTVTSDGNNTAAAMIELTNQAINLVGETDKTVAVLKQGLPKALEDIQAASDNLRNVSAQVHSLSYLGIVLLIVGLLISGWCFAHGMGALMIASTQVFDTPATRIIAAVD